MLPDRVSNPGPLTYESGALPIALRGPAEYRRRDSKTILKRELDCSFLSEKVAKRTLSSTVKEKLSKVYRRRDGKTVLKRGPAYTLPR